MRNGRSEASGFSLPTSRGAHIRIICARGIRGPGLAGSGRLRLAVIKEGGQSEVPRPTQRRSRWSHHGGAGAGAAHLKAGLRALTLGLAGGTIS
jgi:hypothetical protein